MNLRSLTSAGRRRAQVDAVVNSYVAWQRECVSVRAAYGAWTRAAKADACRAFAAYRVALDREEHAANVYARLSPRAQDPPELDLARQLAHLAISLGPL